MEKSAELSSLLEVGEDQAAAILRHCKWNMERVYESDDFVKLKIRAGVAPEHPLPPPRGGSDREITCSICEMTSPVSECYSLICGHLFCKDCWKGYLTAKVEEYNSLDCKCMQRGCKAIVTQKDFSYLLNSSDALMQYKVHALNNFIMNDPNLVRCPAPGCNFVLRCVDGSGTSSSGWECECQCGHVFCFNCAKNHYTALAVTHYPALCSNMRAWEEKTSSTAKYFSLRKKPCPNKKCGIPIVKCGCPPNNIICNNKEYCPNQACNHLICPNCRMEFCWICGREWQGHGDYYKCNKDLSDDLEEQERFKECYLRYDSHDKSLRTVRDKIAHSDELFQQLCEEGKTSQHSNFIKEAEEEVARCYQTLKYTYVYLFFKRYRENEKIQKQLFQTHQGSLEKFTDKLQEKIEKEVTGKTYNSQLEESLIQLTGIIKSWRERLFDH